MSISPEGLVHNSIELYSLPTIYLALDREINTPLSNLQDIANILLDDANLSARLLRLTNSAMYNFPSKVDTISRAITIVGTDQLRDLALSTSVLTLFSGIDAALVNMEEFWRHSIGVGIAARVIATYQSEPNVERFYLMGLLHDIGRLIMFAQIPERMSGLIEQGKTQQQLLHRLEEEQLGFDHGAVAMQLLQNWKLPAPIREAVGYHHHPLRSRAHSREASIVHVADLLVHGLQLGSSSGIELVPTLSEPAWQNIGLSAALLPDILGHIEHQYHDVVEIFLS